MGEAETTDERLAYANFVFPNRHQALAFANCIIEKEWQVSVSYTDDSKMWRATVERKIQILHREVNCWLATLTVRAAQMGGDYDGWGTCPPLTLPHRRAPQDTISETAQFANGNS